MKKIAVVCFVLVLQGLNSFGQTNAVPAKSESVTRPVPHEQKAVAKPNGVGLPAVPSGGVLSHVSDTQPPPLDAFLRIQHGELLTPRGAKPEKNFGAMLKEIFRSENDQMGETCVRDTIVTIFPPGR